MDDHRLTLLLAGALLLAGCVFDKRGMPPLTEDLGADGPATLEGGADGWLDGSPDGSPDGPLPDGPPDGPLPEAPPDAPHPDAPVSDGPPCGGATCPLGCNTSLGRCNRIVPSNGEHPKGYHDQITAVITATTKTIAIDTDTGQILDGTTKLRDAGNDGGVDKGIYYKTKSQGSGLPKVALFGIESLTLPASIKLEVTGSHALALYVKTGPVKIDGIMVALHSGSAAGPGGYAGGSPEKNGASCGGGEGKGGVDGSSDRESGGGGGAFGAAGSKGGKGGSYAGGSGGAPVGTATLIPLRGGCGGGGGGGSGGGAGGGGGGAIQISANSPISVTGRINVFGSGGRGDSSQGGGGGGAGGGILLEGPSVTVSGAGMLAANGGGGGAGGTSNNGAAGTVTFSAASGGNTTAAWDGDGGKGGWRYSPSGTGGGSGTYNGGGGGGAMGRIRINALKVTVGNTNATPAPSILTTIKPW